MRQTTIAQTQVKYNQIPKESILLKRIPTLGKNDRVQYRVYGAYDPAQPNKFFGRTLALPCEDTIMDPETNEVYDIAFIKGVGPGGVPEVGEIMFQDFHASTITLFGNSAEDQRKYQYIELCNYLAENDSRDNNKAILIEKIDDEKDLVVKRAKRKKRQDALNVVEAMNDSEIINYIHANKIPDPGSDQKRRAALEDLAENFPDKLMKSPTANFTSLYPLIDEASSKKLITWNKTTREYAYADGDVIVQVGKGFGVSQKEELAKYLTNNKKALEALKALLNG